MIIKKYKIERWNCMKRDDITVGVCNNIPCIYFLPDEIFLKNINNIYQINFEPYDSHIRGSFCKTISTSRVKMKVLKYRTKKNFKQGENSFNKMIIRSSKAQHVSFIPHTLQTISFKLLFENDS